MKVLVRCTYEIEVELPDDSADPRFTIEENGCPATGVVGAAFDANYRLSDVIHRCWACSLKGKNQLVSAG